MDIKKLVKEYQDYNITLRREFHENPEASMQEYNTQKRIINELEKMHIECNPAGGTGVVGYIYGKDSGKTIALRADMDALEIKEENNIEYKSKVDGFMHGCGHDGHISSLLTAAKILNELRSNFYGTVKLIFQPGEEIGQGALSMIKDGAMDNVDAIFGMHLWNNCDIGKISVDPGPRLASAGKFSIKIKGKGGHGSMPHQGIDATVVGAAILSNLQAIVSRETSPLKPAVVSVGIFKSGTRFNVISEEAYLEGTTRCFDLEINDLFEEQIKRVAENTAKSYRAEVELKYDQIFVPTINDMELSIIAKESVKNLYGDSGLEDNLEKTTASEDFAYYSDYAKTMYAFVGARNPSKLKNYPHHNPKYNFDEDALNIAAGLYVQFAIDYLSKE